jgi:hypothetical protein
MTETFRPYQVTFGPASWFRLTRDEVASLSLHCPITHAANRGPAGSEAPLGPMAAVQGRGETSTN